MSQAVDTDDLRDAFAEAWDDRADADGQPFNGWVTSEMVANRMSFSVSCVRRNLNKLADQGDLARATSAKTGLNGGAETLTFAPADAVETGTDDNPESRRRSA